MTRLIEGTRYVALVGVVSLLLASVAAFGWGAIKTVDAAIVILSSYGKDPYIAVLLIEIVDSLLIATALYVFAVSMYELFIGKLTLPDWMLAHDLHELKNKLGGVIILVMVVKFLERLVEWRDAYTSLLFAIAVGIVSAAIVAMGYFSKRE